MNVGHTLCKNRNHDMPIHFTITSHEVTISGAVDVRITVVGYNESFWWARAERTEIDQVGRKEAVIRAAIRALRMALEETA